MTAILKATAQSPLTGPDYCANCNLDRNAACAEGTALALIPREQRTGEQRQQMFLMLSLLQSCRSVCREAGGWRVE